MGKESKLEEVFWKDGKWENSNGERVNPEFIGPPKYFSYIERLNYYEERFPSYMRDKRINSKLSELRLENRGYLQVNAFLESNEHHQNCVWTETAINFLKI